MFRVLALILLLQICTAVVHAQSVSPDTSLAQTASDEKEEPANTKSPTGALLRSLIVPGWGQLYNGKELKAAVIFAAETTLIGTAIYWDRQAEMAAEANHETARLVYEDNRNLAYWLLAATVVYSMLDAYVDAHFYDFDEGESLANISLIPEPNSPAVALRLRIPF